MARKEAQNGLYIEVYPVRPTCNTEITRTADRAVSNNIAVY